MPGCTVAQGALIGERIRRSLAHSPTWIRASEPVTVTASIGLAGSETHGHGIKSLLVAADQALYEAKRAGRNRLVARTEKPAWTYS
jgi:two-component system, cell cycle response regulator